jgi:hypothetical protein
VNTAKKRKMKKTIGIVLIVAALVAAAWKFGLIAKVKAMFVKKPL